MNIYRVPSARRIRFWSIVIGALILVGFTSRCGTAVQPPNTPVSAPATAVGTTTPHWLTEAVRLAAESIPAVSGPALPAGLVGMNAQAAFEVLTHAGYPAPVLVSPDGRTPLVLSNWTVIAATEEAGQPVLTVTK